MISLDHTSSHTSGVTGLKDSVSQPRRRILLALAGCDRRLLNGIERFALEQNWDISRQIVRNRSLPWGWKGDGILAWLGARNDVLEFALKSKVPLVDFNSRHVGPKIPRVLEDHSNAAKMVAEHCLARRFLHFVFYSRADCQVYEQRGEHFSKFLQKSGRDCIWLRWHESAVGKAAPDAWKLRRQWLARQLKPLPKPAVIFAADDQHAIEVLDACEMASIDVPGQILIFGAGDHLLAPEAFRVPLSSVDTNLETVGYRGAKLLDELMSGASPPACPILVPAAGLVVRKSSDVMAVGHEGVTRCLRLIHDRLHESLGIRDFEKTVNISSRSLHNAFLTHWGCTPKQALVNARINRAKQLLLEPANHKLDAVARDCGYRSVAGLRATFSRVLGMTPNLYRKIQWSNKTQ